MMKDHCFEFVEGHGEEFSQVVGGEDTWVELALPHDAQVLGSAHILRRCDLLEVTCSVVQDVAVDMVDLHARCTRADEGLPDKMMTETVAELAHTRVTVTLLAPLRKRAKRWFEFLTVGIVELAVRAREECFSFDALLRDLSNNRYLHKTASSEDVGSLTSRACRFPNWRCKSTAVYRQRCCRFATIVYRTSFCV